eukprot:scaffold263327_cov24-Tisochrysis_lutea.AAC.1
MPITQSQHCVMGRHCTGTGLSRCLAARALCNASVKLVVQVRAGAREALPERGTIQLFLGLCIGIIVHQSRGMHCSAAAICAYCKNMELSPVCL